MIAKKLTTVFVILLWFIVSLQAKVVELSQAANGLSISFTLPHYTMHNDTLPEFYGVSEVFSSISVDSGDFSPWGEVGFPMLPHYTLIFLQVAISKHGS